MRVVIDVNVWMSFCIGQLLDGLPQLLASPEVEIFTCVELNSEFAEVASRPKLNKYIRKNRVEETLELLEAYATLIAIETRTADFSDAKDNYLLDLCDTASADFLVTGDARLLALHQHRQTKIISYRSFWGLLEDSPSSV